MSKKKELMKNTIIIFMGKVCTQLISFLLLPLYTSYLLTEEYGFVDLVTTYVTLIVPIITMELEMSVFRYLVDCRKDEKEKKKIKKIKRKKNMFFFFYYDIIMLYGR